MAKLNQTQQLLADVNALIATGAKFTASATASASRNYGYYDVTLTCVTDDGRTATATYNGSTVNSSHQTQSVFAQRLATAVAHEAREQLAAQSYRAGSRIAAALREICDELAETETA
jgi:hypothetical protein